jgi:hypothetical protein
MTVPASVAPNPGAFSRRGVNRLSFLERGGEDRPEQRLKHRIVGGSKPLEKQRRRAKGTEGASNNRETWTASKPQECRRSSRPVAIAAVTHGRHHLENERG